MSTNQSPKPLFEQLGGKFPRQATETDRAILATTMQERAVTLEAQAAKCLRRFNLLGFGFSKLAAHAMQKTTNNLQRGVPYRLERDGKTGLKIERLTR